MLRNKNFKLLLLLLLLAQCVLKNNYSFESKWGKNGSRDEKIDSKSIKNYSIIHKNKGKSFK